MVFFGKKLSLVLIPLILILGVFIFLQIHIFQKTRVSQIPPSQKININGKVKIKYPQDYTIVMLGDSMTEKLGNSDELRVYLKKYYPDKSFEILNYGFGSTNILSAQERLEKETHYGRAFRPILDIAFDLILIESFGHNPLSHLPLEEGLQKQNEALDKMVDAIKKEAPVAKIVFVATISPNKRRYGEGQVVLSPEKRAEWANERIAYIKNHIEYAKTHQIPLVNIFEESLNSDADGNLDYISTADFIHPSPSGVYFISAEIAKFIYESNILIP